MFDASFMKCNNYLFAELHLSKSSNPYLSFLFIASCNIIRESRGMNSRAELYNHRFYHDQY